MTPRMTGTPLFHIVLQKRGWDCGIATLASLMGEPYEEVLREAAQRFKIERGMHAREMIAVAKVFNVELKHRVKNIDVEEHNGILGIVHKGGHHAVLLMNGLVFDPGENGTVWDAETYIKIHKLKIIDILEEVE